VGTTNPACCCCWWWCCWLLGMITGGRHALLMLSCGHTNGT
jgi:hypothetical protein